MKAWPTPREARSRRRGKRRHDPIATTLRPTKTPQTDLRTSKRDARRTGRWRRRRSYRQATKKTGHLRGGNGWRAGFRPGEGVLVILEDLPRNSPACRRIRRESAKRQPSGGARGHHGRHNRRKSVEERQSPKPDRGLKGTPAQPARRQAEPKQWPGTGDPSEQTDYNPQPKNPQSTTNLQKDQGFTPRRENDIHRQGASKKNIVRTPNRPSRTQVVSTNSCTRGPTATEYNRGDGGRRGGRDAQPAATTSAAKEKTARRTFSSKEKRRSRRKKVIDRLARRRERGSTLVVSTSSSTQGRDGGARPSHGIRSAKTRFRGQKGRSWQGRISLKQHKEERDLVHQIKS